MSWRRPRAFALRLHVSAAPPRVGLTQALGPMSQFVRHIESYCHNGRVGVLLEFALEDDFTLKTDEFIALAKDCAMHVAAFSPSSVDELLQQPFVKNADIAISRLLSDVSCTLGENISIIRLVCWHAVANPPVMQGPPDSPANVVRFGSRSGA